MGVSAYVTNDGGWVGGWVGGWADGRAGCRGEDGGAPRKKGKGAVEKRDEEKNANEKGRKRGVNLRTLYRSTVFTGMCMRRKICGTGTAFGAIYICATKKS